MTGDRPRPKSRRKAAIARRSNLRARPTPEEVSSLRKTGIRVVGDTSWGTHICVFYETKQDLLDTAVSYFEAGLHSNEFCVWAISDPITEREAMNALARAIPDLDRRLAVGQIELLQGSDWYLKGDEFDLQRITGGWRAKLRTALDRGHEEIRISGNAFWIETNRWEEFRAYEQELDRSVAGQKMIVLCTYPLHGSKAVDVLDVARAHQFTVARRKGNWELLETPELKQAKQEIRRLNDALNTLSDSSPGHASLTPRERLVLAQLVRGFSSKEIARALRLSPRTVEFHRTNLLKKVGARNSVDLLRRVLGE
jgi:DNA-binding CsgD family transcriptional regulator